MAAAAGGRPVRFLFEGVDKSSLFPSLPPSLPHAIISSPLSRRAHTQAASSSFPSSSFFSWLPRACGRWMAGFMAFGSGSEVGREGGVGGGSEKDRCVEEARICMSAMPHRTAGISHLSRSILPINMPGSPLPPSLPPALFPSLPPSLPRPQATTRTSSPRWAASSTPSSTTC